MRVIILLFLFTSCASYVNSFHRQIDNDERARRAAMARRMKQTQNRGADNRPIQNPMTLNGAPTANTQRELQPSTRRSYNSKGTRRYKAQDLIDNDKDGSLWSGENSESFLFVTNSKKREGDIVIVEVLEKLKDRIQDELKRNFPDRPTKKKKSKKDDEKDEEKKEEVAAKPAAGGVKMPNKVYDKISAKVVSKVNKDYLLIRGRKEVMFKNYKRYFEIQAIVSHKDITAQDTVTSNKILEPKINVLRY